MRFLALALSLAACSSEPACHDTTCVAPADVPAFVDAAPDVAAVGDADAAPDAVAVADTGPDAAVGDAPPAPDVDTPRDAPRDVAPEADPCGSFLRQCEVNGVNMCVNVQAGRMQSDGTTIHCGMCGNTCAAGVACFGGTCMRL